jgi:hypothetical protein
MGMKEEIQQAKERAADLSKDKGLTLDDIMVRLNVEFSGFYHVVNGRIVRDHDADYLPTTVIF